MSFMYRVHLFCEGGKDIFVHLKALEKPKSSCFDKLEFMTKIDSS